MTTKTKKTAKKAKPPSGAGAQKEAAKGKGIPNAGAGAQKGASDKRVGLSGLVFLVVSAMIGGGVFMMPTQMANPEANGAPYVGPGSEIITWAITALGMWFLVCTFRLLTKIRPDLKAGMFSYALSGFGRIVGFLMAWGYWIFNAVSCAAYGILVMSTLHYFFPTVFTSSNGNSLIAIVVASIISWVIIYLASRGAKEGAGINMIGTIAKIVPIIVFIVVCLALFNPQTFTADFWATQANNQQAPSLLGAGGIANQIGRCMMVTLWVFLGIEGAVVFSGEAKSQKDVSRATLIGFLATLGIYVLVSLLPFGLYLPSQLGQFANPSMGTIMADHFGAGGLALINIGIIVSVLSAWFVWILLLTQMPLYAAREKLFPPSFEKKNKHGAPTVSLIWSGIIIQVVLAAAYFLSGNAWDLLTSITSSMAAPCYLFCALFLLKIALIKDEWIKTINAERLRARALIVGILASVFGLFLVFAGNTLYLLIAFAIYALGIPFFLITRARYKNGFVTVAKDLQTSEWVGIAIVTVLGLAGMVALVLAVAF